MSRCVASFLLLLLGCSAGSVDPASGPATSASVAAEPAGEPDSTAVPEETLDGPEERPLTAKGKISGAEYLPVVALGTGTFMRSGHVHLVLELFEEKQTCEGKAKLKEGHRQVMIGVPWEGGAKLDLSQPPPDENFNPNVMKRWTGKRWDPVSGWKAPTGSVEVFEAPTKSGEKGRVRLKVRVGGAKLRGDLPVLLCVDAK